MTIEQPDGWELLDDFLELNDVGVDVFGRIIGPNRIFTLQSDIQAEVTSARMLVALLEQGANIQICSKD